MLLAIFLISADKPWDQQAEIAELKEQGRGPFLRHFIAIGLYLAAAANLGLTLILLGTLPWWTKDFGARAKSLTRPPAEKKLPARTFWLLLAGVVVLGAGLRLPLASRSLWWDELASVREAIVGAWTPKKDQPEELEFREAGWDRAAWFYLRPTNHPVASLSAKASDSVWRAVARPVEPHAVSDLAIRFPMLLCSLAAIAVAGVLGRRWGHSWVGLVAAVILAAHPWHIRYGIDARAYTFIVLWGGLGCLWLTLLFQSGGKWRYWWLFGLNQFLLVWSFLQTVILAGVLVLVAVFLIFQAWKKARDRWIAVGRLVVVNVCAGMAFFQIFGPNLYQMSTWFAKDLEAQGHPLTHALFKDFLSQWLFGLPFDWPAAPEAEGLPTLTRLSTEHPALFWLAVALVFCGGWWGIRALLKERGRIVWTAVGTLLAGGLLMAILGVTRAYFYHRFLIFILVPWTLMVAAGWCAMGKWVGTNLWRFARFGIPAACFLLYCLVSAPQISVLLRRPYEPQRNVTDFFASEAVEGQPPLRAVYGHGAQNFRVYDPGASLIYDHDSLVKVMMEAVATGRPLYVAYGHSGFNRATPSVAEGLTVMDDPRIFKPVASFPGIEPDFFYRVFEYIGQEAPQ